MKEELHQMLDGELPDDAMAELLHILSVDPEKRRLFRQQMVLQHALVRNESIDFMTPDEDHEVLANLTRAVGITEEPSGGEWRSWMAVGMLTVGLFVGGGAGYLVGASYNEPQMATRYEPAVEKLQMAPAPTVIAPTIDPAPYTGLMSSAVTTALATETRPVITSAPAASKRVTPRATVRKKPTFNGSGNDLTGAPEARARQRAKKSQRRR